MAPKTWIKVGGALLLLAWGPFLYAELTSDPAETKGRELPDEQAGAADQVAVIEDDARDAAVAKTDEPAPEAVEAPAAPGTELPTDNPEVKVQVDPAHDPAAPVEDEETPVPPVASGQVEVYKRAFETQPRDALWAADTETRLRALFGSDELPKEMLHQAACRKAVCRVEIVWSEELADSYALFEKAVLDTFGGELAVDPQGTPDEETKLQVNLYLPRKGYTVADLAR